MVFERPLTLIYRVHTVQGVSLEQNVQMRRLEIRFILRKGFSMAGGDSFYSGYSRDI